MINRSGSGTVLDQSTGSPIDRFSVSGGVTTTTYDFDATVSYNATITYADGSTVNTVVVVA